MIVQSKVRDYVKELGDYKVGGDLLKALDEKDERAVELFADLGMPQVSDFHSQTYQDFGSSAFTSARSVVL